MAEGSTGSEITRLLDQYLSGEIPEANALPQLLHLRQVDYGSVLAALKTKVLAVLANADGSAAGARAGTLLVNAVLALDGPDPSAAAASEQTQERATAQQVSRLIIDHVVLATGGYNAAKEKAVRAQSCAIIAGLAPAANGHKKAEEKLLEYAIDKLPTIREKAVRGLAKLSSNSAEQALLERTCDQCTAVRASAVLGLQVSSRTVATLLERLDDVEACVRAQLFRRFAEQPAAATQFGPAALARLVLGLTDRSSTVRTEAGVAVDAWHQHFGGILPLLVRCNTMDDEELGEAAAGALIGRFPSEGAKIAQTWLRSSMAAQKKAKESQDTRAATVLLARLSVASMRDEDRDEAVDVPSLLEGAHTTLDELAHASQEGRSWNDFFLRQLLLILLSVDICDESLRRDAESLAEALLLRAPIPSGGETYAVLGERPQRNTVDLGVAILRQCCGLGPGSQARSAKRQMLEAECSMRAALLVSELCAPLKEGQEDKEGQEGEGFSTRRSLRLEELNETIEKHVRIKDNLVAKKKKAAQEEDFLAANDAKAEIVKTEKRLQELKVEAGRIKAERDCVLLRALAIISALLRWSHSDIRRDRALQGTFQQIVQPIMRLPALSEEVEVAALRSIGLFCTLDVGYARAHWSLWTTLISNLRKSDAEGQGVQQRRKPDRRSCACAEVAANALADCVLIHGERGVLDEAELLGAGAALAAVPFAAREVVIKPLCSWLLGCGALFFEEHLREPEVEVQWALGWLLTETFAVLPNDGTNECDENDNGEALKKGAAQLRHFFTLLPKLPGKHSAGILLLAVESVAESGLWRRSVLKPLDVESFHTRWSRNFSWPQLFAFVHERLPPELRFRLWRCALQLCVSSPTLAPFAEVPRALAAVAGEAPPGATELLEAALALGADKNALAPLRARLPPASTSGLPEELMMSHEEAQAAERERRKALAEVGVDIDSWAPAEFEAPKKTPPHHRLRAMQSGSKNAGGRKAVGASKVALPVAAGPPEAQLPASQAEAPAEAAAAGDPQAEPDAKRRRQRVKGQMAPVLPLCDANACSAGA